MRARIATAVALVVFLVLAGTGVSYAFWSTSASTTGAVAVDSPSTTNCVSPTKLLNGSFESPNISPSPYSQLTPSLVPGWAVLNDTVIELWRGQGGVVPPSGAQLAELNGNAYGTLYQDVVTVPGQTLRWSVQHRGREGVDGMRVSVNASGAALVQQDQFTDPAGPWVLHTGAYVVPAGQTSTRISLVPVSTANNNVSIGNLIDDVTLGSGPCLEVTTAITNVTTGGSVFRPGDVVQYTSSITNVGGAPAMPSTFSAVVPTNVTYQAGSLAVDGTARTDALADDVADYVSGTTTVAARIGYGATATAGGIVAPDQTVTVAFRGTIAAAAAGGSVTFTSSADYADLFAPTWPLSATSTPLDTPIVIPDTTAPTAPTALAASGTTGAQTVLNWTASTDAVGVTGYRIVRNGTVVVADTASTATSYTATGLTAGQPYWFWVQALDAAGNVSTASTGIPVITSFGDGDYLVRNTPFSDRCLAAANNNDDAALRTSNCNTGSANQLWTFIASGTTYLVQPNAGTDRRWDLATAPPAANVLLEVSSDDVGAARTLWTPTVVWDSTLNASYLAFKSDTTDFCINIATTGNNVEGTLQTCSATATNQRFLLTAVP